jgi:hypothetical protein
MIKFLSILVSSKKHFFTGLFFLLVSSCSTTGQKLKSVDDTQVQRSGEQISRWMMPSPDSWGFFSDSSQCMRRSDILFLNGDKIKEELKLSDEQIVFWQSLANELWLSKISSFADANEVLKFSAATQDVETAYTQMLGGVSVLSRSDTEKTMTIIDLDQWSEAEHKLLVTKFLDRYEDSMGLPILFSKCRSSQELRLLRDSVPGGTDFYPLVLGLDHLIYSQQAVQFFFPWVNIFKDIKKFQYLTPKKKVEDKLIFPSASRVAW